MHKIISCLYLTRFFQRIFSFHKNLYFLLFTTILLAKYYASCQQKENIIMRFSIFFTKIFFLTSLLYAPYSAADIPATTSQQTNSSGFVHGISFHDYPKYKDGFSHFDFASPNSKKGGILKKISIGSFDCINKTYKCTRADGIDLTRDTLMSRSLDEPFSLYGLVAEKVNLANDGSWIEFQLNPNAKWHDGSSITPEDIIFSLKIQREKGLPFARSLYSQVQKVEKTSKNSVKFSFKKKESGYNKELPLIIAMMGLYPKKYYENNAIEFDQPTLTPPLVSGPYKIKKVEPGRYIVYERVPNYWAKELPVNKGRYNFDKIRYDYYRDKNAAFQAFKSGSHDIYKESSPQSWKRSHKGVGYDKGTIKKVELKNTNPVGLRAFSFNTRKPIFKDKRVRKAIITAFDRNFIIKSVFPGFKENNSYFDNTDLAAPVKPTLEEIALLKKIALHINPHKLVNHAKKASTATPRLKRKEAINLLKKAGWSLKNGILTNDKTGKLFQFELLVANQEEQKLALAFARNMATLGIKVNVLLIDAAQYERRKQDRSYDMIATWWATSISPGNELSHYWSCAAKDNSASRNYPGICSAVSDKLISIIPKSSSRKELRAATHALDRILMDEAYLVPLFFNPYLYVAMKKKIHYENATTHPVKDFHFWWAK